MRRPPWEAFFWLFALVALGIYSPVGDPHFTLCPLAQLGFEFCPGCGLGRSISFLLHGDVQRSFATHPLGVFAVIVLSYRIFQLTQNYIKLYGKNN